MKPDVTVVSVFYNRADTVDLSMSSLAGQKDVSFRATVVDDESHDGTWEALQHWRSERISVHRQQNRGFTATLIALCEAADTEFIALHGAGDESFPSRLAKQVALLRAYPSAVVAGCGIENVDEVSGKRWEVRPPQLLRSGPIEGGFGISHGEVLFRRDAYVRAGGYRPAFTVGQASDLFRRMSRLGDFAYVEEVLYRRHLRRDGVNANTDMIAERLILSAISVAVHRHRHRRTAQGEPNEAHDQLDRHGLLLPYLGVPDRRIARSLAQAAMLYWTAGDLVMARRLARRSVGEAWTWRGWLTRLATVCGIGPFRIILEQVLARLARGEDEFSRDRLRSSGQTRMPELPSMNSAAAD